MLDSCERVFASLAKREALSLSLECAAMPKVYLARSRNHLLLALPVDGFLAACHTLTYPRWACETGGHLVGAEFIRVAAFRKIEERGNTLRSNKSKNSSRRHSLSV